MSENLHQTQLPRAPAVVVRNGTKSYKLNEPVLAGINISVMHGGIYGLLGSSGCGKTTVLSCILGLQKLDSGQVRVFGDKPGTGRSGIPGRGVGYMPQEISLLLQLSIQEMLVYFGGLVGMTRDDIQCRTAFLSALLELQSGSTRIHCLSGGQQRRLSLAVALIHNPKFLVLDEPTVGVDPLLRQRIWEHLRELAAVERRTIIVTTHYIEECRRADRIGVMHSGRILSQDSPDQLFWKHSSSSLEEIVLSLCKQDAAGMTSRVAEQSEMSGYEPSDFTTAVVTTDQRIYTPDTTKANGPNTDQIWRILVLARKNLTVQTRSPLLLYLVIMLPATILAVVSVCMGQPKDLGMGIVNEETASLSGCRNISRGVCSMDRLSCRFIDKIHAEDFRLTWFPNKEAALHATTAGDVWGYMHIPSGFSENLVRRLGQSGNISELAMNRSQIHLQLDETNRQVAITVKTNIYLAYSRFLKGFLADCGFDSRLGEHALQYKQPVFGSHSTDFRSFLVHSLTPSFMFYCPVVSTSVRLIGEKKSGVLTRSLVIGVQTWEIMTAQMVSEFVVLFVQALLTYIINAYVLGSAILGSHFLIILICMLSSYGGVTMGVMLAAMCSDEFQAAVLGMAIFLPLKFVSGILWPVEGMYTWMQYVAPVFPCTLSGEAVRSVAGRGWEFTHPHVWPGVTIPVGYIFGFLATTALYVRTKGYQN